MSKHPSDNTKHNLLRRGLAGILTLALMLGLLPAAVAPAQAALWATPYVETLTEWGVMRGDISGNMAPERSITRAEFVTMMNRAYGYTKTAGHPFTDVGIRDWYYEDIDIAYNIGYFKGVSPTRAAPNSPLTREQAAVLLARNMMMQPTVGETLGFSDSRTLSDWSRGLVGAATENGILSGYNDGSFKPQNNITRGEVAAMLVRAIGTPVQEAGDHALGNVYGNVTVNTSGVKLRDGVITGNLYLTGGIDLGEVLMENVTVLGEIIVSGSGESNSSQSSIVLRNVTANAMSVDSIGDQFVTIRAEGNTDIKSTTVRTNAYVDDSALPGYGLWKIIQDGGKLLQLAGNAKEVVNKTPNSETQVVQGTANKITMDEYAKDSSVLVDGDARVGELDLDVATKVTGEGDIKNLNVGAAGSTVEQLPDSVTIRPGITSDINGSTMNSSQAAQASADPRLLAGYPKAKDVAPTSATLVFSVNKPGTIYWAVSAVSDGSVKEEELIENPVHGGKIIQAGSINATAAETEYTASVSKLTQDGSYYISAILVDGRGERSPVKVAAFATPDGTKPAFVSNPIVTMATTKTAQVTGTPNKSCLLYWALLPADASAPTAAEFKANAISGNLGYGSMDVTKNVSQSVNVNRGNLREKTNYVAYLWLTDHDGAQSSQVYRVPIYIPDETPPVVSDVRQTNGDATSVEVSFTMNETGKLHWAIVTDEMHENKSFIDYDGYVGYEAGQAPSLDRGVDLRIDNADYELSSKIKVMSGSGQGAIVSGSANVTAANTITRILQSAARGLDPKKYNTSTFYIYYVGEDSEKPSNLSQRIGVLEVNVRDTEPPLFVEQRFDSYNENDKVHPLADTGIRLVFSEPVQHGANTNDRGKRFLNLYQAVEELVKAGRQEDDQELIEKRDAMAKELYAAIKLYQGTDTEVVSDQKPDATKKTVLDYRYAVVSREGGEFIIYFPHATGRTRTVTGADGTTTTEPIYSANLDSGVTYHFEFANIYDCAGTPNRLEPNTSGGIYRVEDFRTAYAQVELQIVNRLPAFMEYATNNGADYFKAVDKDDLKYGQLTFPTTVPPEWDETSPSGNGNAPQRIDRCFKVNPLWAGELGKDENMYYDILIWSDTDMVISLYSRDVDAADGDPWILEGTTNFVGTSLETEASGGNGSVFRSLTRNIQKKNRYDYLTNCKAKEYVIHVDQLNYDGSLNGNKKSWNDTINLQLMVVAGSQLVLNDYLSGDRSLQNLPSFNGALAAGASSIGTPDPRKTDITFTDELAPDVTRVTIVDDDTNPKIQVFMNRPGQVNWLLIPLSNLTYGNMAAGSTTAPVPAGVRITENMITRAPGETRPINGYSADTYPEAAALLHDAKGNIAIGAFKRIDGTMNERGTEVDWPTGDVLVGSNFPSTVIRGRTLFTPINNGAEITLPTGVDLSPNTVYLLCLAPQGVTIDSLSDQVTCFRFTTNAAQVPVLTLNNREGTNVNGTVNRSSTVQARLLLQSSLTASTVFGERFDLTGNTTPGQTVPTEYTGPNYTVLKALQDTYYGDDTKPGCSVFDEFASEALKERVRQVVEFGSMNNAIYGSYGPQPVTVPSTSSNVTVPVNFTENRPLDDTASYVAVGIAYITQGNLSSYAFRALAPLQVADNNPPLIDSVSVGNLSYDGTNITGTVTINFNKALYREGLTGGLLPVAQQTADGTGYRGLGGVFGIPVGGGITIPNGTPVTYPISNVQFTVNKTGTSFEIPITAGILRSRWDHGTPGGSVVVRWDSQNQQFTVSVSNNLKSPDYEEL